MRGAAWLVLLLLAGCVQPEPQPPDPDVGERSGEPFPGAPTANYTVNAPPLHPVGRAWTYRGVQEYDPEPEVTVVVAQANEDGYLFAGAAPKDLVYEALWADPLYGPHDRALVRTDFERKWLSFPLYDGKTWAYTDTMSLTARRASLETFNGTEEGFVIEGSNGAITRRWEYAPALGVIVRHVTTRADGTVIDDYALTSVREGSPWVWYEVAEIGQAVAEEPALLEVPEGYDNVILSAGGAEGGHVQVRGPTGETWSTTFDGAEEWRHGMLPATPGRWSAAIVGEPYIEIAPPIDTPLGWAMVRFAAVRWIEGAEGR